jgi:hypothetical protein
MTSWLFWIALVIGITARLASAEVASPSSQRGRSALVVADESGRLVYRTYSARGDVLPDFSQCGFGGGGVPLPVAAAVVVVEARAEGDDTARIQAALNEVAARPLGADGLRGAVLLRRGRYRVSGMLQLQASGVVLRGESDETDGTVVVATTRKQQPLVRVGGPGGVREAVGSAVEVADDYVPVGSRAIRVSDPSGFKVGQTVHVIRRSNAAWIHELGMDRIPGRPSAPETTKQWTPFELKFDRVVTAVTGDVLTLDAPIGCAIERRWGGGVVVPTRDERIERCGVENLRAVSVYDAAKTARQGSETVWVDEDHATHAVDLANVRDAWVRKVTTEFFYHGPVAVGGRSKWITVEDCRSLQPVSQITGGRRYPYNVEGQLVLVQRCYSDRARHAFVFGARVPGPNVFLRCRSEHDYATSEPHHRWSVAGLYDNVEAHLAIQDRQWMGSGHGWAGANYVAWNCRGELVCQRPPTAQNFAIGFVGRRGKEAYPRPAGWWESEGAPVLPVSLYEAQLRARLAQ